MWSPQKDRTSWLKKLLVSAIPSRICWAITSLHGSPAAPQQTGDTPEGHFHCSRKLLAAHFSPLRTFTAFNAPIVRSIFKVSSHLGHYLFEMLPYNTGPSNQKQTDKTIFFTMCNLSVCLFIIFIQQSEAHQLEFVLASEMIFSFIHLAAVEGKCAFCIYRWTLLREAFTISFVKV